VHFNSTGSRLPVFSYDGKDLPNKDEFRYLGMVVDRRMNMRVAEENAVRPFMAAQRRIKDFVKELGLSGRPHALLWLSKVYGIPAGMYACQIWGSKYLCEGSEFDSQLQKKQMCSMRRVLGVKGTSTNWAVLRECGQEPLQFYWFRAAVRFYNSMLGSNSETLRRVMKADLHLAESVSSCWSAEVSKAFDGLPSASVFKRHMSRAEKVPLQVFVGELRFRQQQVWRVAGALCPRAVNKKTVTYHKWCGLPVRDKGETPFRTPAYLFKDFDRRDVARNVSRFRLRAHGLRVESHKWRGGSPNCDKCECAEVQDEKHALFYCSCSEMCALRRKYKDLFDSLKPRRMIARPAHADSDFIPFLPSNLSITDSEINDFLNQNSFKLFKFVSELVSIYDSGCFTSSCLTA
jgi:hypothetical protein